MTDCLDLWISVTYLHFIESIDHGLSLFKYMNKIDTVNITKLAIIIQWFISNGKELIAMAIFLFHFHDRIYFWPASVY